MSDNTYRPLGPDEEIEPGDEIAWIKADLNDPNAWSLVSGSIGLTPRPHENYAWRRPTNRD